MSKLCKNKYFFFILLTFFIVNGIFAQNIYNSTNVQAIKLYEKGLEKYNARYYDEAKDLFSQALEKDANFAEAHFRLATIHELYKNEAKMLFHFEKAVQNAPTKKAFARAYPMLIYFTLLTADYDKTLQYCEQFIQLKPDDAAALQYAKKVKGDCLYAKEHINTVLPYNAIALPAPINQLYLQYFPALTADNQYLIFTGRKATNNPQRPSGDEDMYISQWNNGQWSNPTSISNQINTAENEGTCSISADGRTIVFTSCNSTPDNLGKCDLYITRKIGDEWTKPVNIGAPINSVAWESQPSLSADGKTLYFVSNRPGGLGGKDIWVSYLGTDNRWTMPKNLGNVVNTVFDEVSPLIHVNGKTLFFSSNGHTGFGGYDIFSAERQANLSWTAPKNMGYPLNTHEDQVGLFITTDGTKGFYSVEKIENGTLKSSILYSFDLPPEMRPSVVSRYVKGKVYNAQTKEPLKADIDLYDLNNNIKQSSVSSDEKNGTYLIVLNEKTQYGLQVLKPGFAFKSLSFQPDENNVATEIDIPLEPIVTGTVFRLENIFFEYGKYDLKETSKTELNELVTFMKANPNVRGEISGHTDNIGQAQANVTLSENRAKAVYDFLVAASIAPNRLEYKGYGDTKPDADNGTEEGRARNRRIEFKIL
ncbi:MAG: hypothetical protein EAZ55_04385 [Cytophagales bacterium]|nr:MAG: hypothetical protein EAZ55_04385 [Cytophagales bacterium]